jgi:hypothetical protein
MCLFVHRFDGSVGCLFVSRSIKLAPPFNNPRDSMARFIAVGYDLKHATAREMLEAATKIQLLMNRNDCGTWP